MTKRKLLPLVRLFELVGHGDGDGLFHVLGGLATEG